MLLHIRVQELYMVGLQNTVVHGYPPSGYTIASFHQPDYPPTSFLPEGYAHGRFSNQYINTTNGGDRSASGPGLEMPVTKDVEETKDVTVPADTEVKKEEEAPLDWEFIKVEKETVEVTDVESHTSRELPVKDEKPSVIGKGREVLGHKRK
ncbi:hypothetical protein L1887_13612 [Cichorium endivia]|nr:hypothetical protein L1887_13612 [Cichorium endivia]